MDTHKDQLAQDTRDALAHLYDYGYLLNHRLLMRLASACGESHPIALRRLRSLLLRAIEDLRPDAGEPTDDRRWRQYEIVYQRYVLGKGLAQLAEEMALSTRQIQREQRRGLEAIAANVATHLQLTEEIAEPSDVALQREIARAASATGAFDSAEQVRRALDTARTMLAAYHMDLVEELNGRSLPVSGDAAVFRQMFLSALSLMARTLGGSTLRVTLKSEPPRALCSIVGTTGQSPNKLSVDLPEELKTLARSQGAQVTLAVEQSVWRLELSLPLAQPLPLVALVEDNKDLVTLLERYLSRQGYQLVHVEDSLETLDRLASLGPDIIVLDVMMRHLDGWELLQRLKADPQFNCVPVVVCTVLNEPDLATCLGADAYLRKPIRLAQFLECLSRLLAT